MTTKNLTGTYSAGYTVSTSVTLLEPTASAYIGGTGIVAAATLRVENLGKVLSGAGAAGGAGHYAGGLGSTGVNLAQGGAVINFNAIAGGNGGAGGFRLSSGTSYGGGAGGKAIVLSATGSIVNHATILGGHGGAGGGSKVVNAEGGAGDAGGDAIDLLAGGSFINGGSVAGGAGGAGGYQAGAGGSGGVGVSLSTGAVTNNEGAIFGGAGGAAGYDGRYRLDVPVGGQGGAGGDAAVLGAGLFDDNGGEIVGGAGGAGGANYGYTGGAGGMGGAGVVVRGLGTLTTSGLIVGGAGGAGGEGLNRYHSHGSAGGAGGDGVDLLGGGHVFNTGTVEGGAGGARGIGSYGRGYPGAGGIGINLQAGGVVINSGVILDAVLMSNGGSITNGSTYDRTASVTGGVLSFGVATASLVNFGLIAGSLDGAAVSFGGGGTVANAGSISGGGGVDGFSGGVGVVLTAVGSVANTGAIAGGAGANGSNEAYRRNPYDLTEPASYFAAQGGGDGGYGVGLRGGGSLTNSAAVTGGAGGAGGSGIRFSYQLSDFIGAGASGGAGGAGAFLQVGTTLANTGAISGGAGGAGGAGGYRGATTDYAVDYTIGARGGAGGRGGAGAIFYGGTLTNSGVILGAGPGAGGAGGVGVRHFYQSGDGGTGAVGGNGGDGVDPRADGTIINSGTIEAGAGGLGGAGAAGYGGGSNGVAGANGAAGNGVVLTGGGALTNGSASDGGALIEGGVGVYSEGPAATVSNFATIAGTSGVAVEFKSAGDRLIDEAGAVFVGAVEGGGGTLELAIGTGTIGGLGAAFGGFASYAVDAGGRWTLTGANAIGAGQSLTDAGALTAVGALANAGAITVVGGGTFTAGGVLSNTGRVTLGALSGHASLVAAGALTLTGGGEVFMSNNAGNIVVGSSSSAILDNVQNTIAGAGNLGDGELTLINGSAGKIESEGQTTPLIIDTGADTIVNAGLIEAAGAGATIASPVANTGFLKADDGNLTINGAVTGTGEAIVGGGTLRFNAAFNQNVVFQGGSGVLALAQSANYTGVISGFSATGTQSLDLGDIGFVSSTKATFSGTPTSGVLTVTDGVHTASIHLAGNYTGDVFIAAADGHGGTSIVAAAPTAIHWLNPVNGSFQNVADWAGGVVPGPGAVAILDAAGSVNYTVTASASQVVGAIETAADATLIVSHAFTAAIGSGGGVNAGLIAVSNAGSLTIGGTLTNTGRVTLGASAGQTRLVAANALTLTGGGEVFMGNNAGNIVVGSSSSAILDNVQNIIAGAGDLGDGELTLINGAAGKIEAEGQTTQLIIDTGADTIANAGLIEAAGAGATIASPVANTGFLKADGGNLTVNGAVTGTGEAIVGGGTLRFNAAFNQNVVFQGGSGALALAQSVNYTGVISGFSTAGTESLDLGDIAFVSATEAAFSGTATGGVLTVTDGDHKASIHLTGNYTGSTFIASSDGHGGTMIVDPREASPAAHRFVAAAASMGAGVGGALHTRAMTASVGPHALAMPHLGQA